MDFVEFESYYMKEEEVNLLLAGLDVPYIYGIASDTISGPLPQEKVNYILIALYQKDVIDWEAGNIVVKQPFSDILAVMSESRKCVVISGGSGEYAIRCCYVMEDKVVITEKSQREEGMLSISYFTFQEWITYIDGYAFAEKMFSDENRKVLLELKNTRTGKESGSIAILETGLHTYLVQKFGLKEEKIPYEKENLKQRLKEWLQEVEE